MHLDPDTCYKAVASHDRRFDGRFFVGVSSTGVYCRPVCAVRTPKRENCTFYESAAAAEKHGFRPCLRCRPELAPGHGLADISGRLAQAAATLIDEGFMAEGSVAALAARIGVTERHLRRLFDAQFGVSVLEYAQTQRLLLAKRLLADTALPVTEVALAAGFGSVRRFNDVLKTRYGLTPLALRRRAADGVADRLVFDLGYRPPFAWDAWLRFLATRAVDGIEAIGDGTYMRTLLVDAGGSTHTGWVRIEHVPRRLVLRVTLSASLARVIPQALGKVRRLCDLGCRPDVVDRHLGELAEAMPGVRLPGSVDGFEIAVRAVVGQVISVVQARRILGALAQHAGQALDGTPPTACATRSRLPPPLPPCQGKPCAMPGSQLARRARCWRWRSAWPTARWRSMRTRRLSRPWRRCARSAASATGPRSMSPCARWAGPMPSRALTMRCARCWASVPCVRCTSAPRNGRRGVPTPPSTCGIAMKR